MLLLRSIILKQYLILLVLMRTLVLTADELHDGMVLVGSGPIGEVLLALESQGLVHGLLCAGVDIMEGFMLEVALALLGVLV